MAMASRVPQPSLWCARGQHERCPHWVSMKVIGIWRGRPRPEVILCADPWHGRQHCPLAGRRAAPRDEWDVRCICPGAEVSRQSFERSEQRRREVAAVMADVDFSDHPDADTVERRLRDAFARHGQEPPPQLIGMSQIMAAARGRRGMRSARLLGLGVGAVARSVGWAWQPAGDDVENRRSLRRMYMSFGVLVGIAGLLTAVAARTSGWRRLPWAVIALTVWLSTLRAIAVGTFVTALARRPES